MPGEDYSREFCSCQLVLPIFCSWRNANIVTLVIFSLFVSLPRYPQFSIYDGE